MHFACQGYKKTLNSPVGASVGREHKLMPKQRNAKQSRSIVAHVLLVPRAFAPQNYRTPAEGSLSGDANYNNLPTLPLKCRGQSCRSAELGGEAPENLARLKHLFRLRRVCA